MPHGSASGEVDDDDQADAAYEQMDRLDALIAATPAASLAGIFAKAKLYTGVAASDAEAAQPLLRSLMRDLFRVPLDDETGLRAVFATLAAPLSAGLLKDVTILLKPTRPKLSDDEWTAALDRCVDGLRNLDACRDVDRLARQVFEPLSIRTTKTSRTPDMPARHPTTFEFIKAAVAAVLWTIGSPRWHRACRLCRNRGYWLLLQLGIKVRRWRVKPERIMDAVERRRREREARQ